MRPAPEHAARRRIGRQDRVVEPEGRSDVRQLEGAGSTPDDDDRVLARRERRAQLRHRFAARSRRACAWSIRHMTRGWAIRNASTRGPARTRQRSGRVATTSAIGDSPRMIETSPKNSPRASRARSVPSTMIAASPSRMT